MSDEVKMPDPRVEAQRFRLPGPTGDPEWVWEPIVRDIMARTLRAAAASAEEWRDGPPVVFASDLERTASEIEAGKP